MNTTFAGLVGKFISLITSTIPVMVGVAMVVFFWGIVKFVYASQDAHGHAEGKELIGWGLVAIFILVSVWGILAVMRSSLGL